MVQFMEAAKSAIAKDGSTVRYVDTVRYTSIFAKRYGTLFLRWYGYGASFL